MTGYGLKNVRHRHRDALTRVSWQQFERLLADHYRRQGYQVEHVGTGVSNARSDGGIDLKLRRADAYVLVQCKHWTAKQVPHNEVHQLIGLMVNEGASGAILITSGEFTPAAIRAAGRLGHVELVDGQQLRAMLGLALESLEPDVDRAALETDDVHSLLSQSSRPMAKDVLRCPPSSRSGRPFAARKTLRLAAGCGAASLLLLIWLGLNSAADRPERVSPPAAQSARTLQSSVAAHADDHVPAAMPHSSRPSVVVKEPAISTGNTMSEEELAEWKRRNAESMRILEATTPEL